MRKTLLSTALVLMAVCGARAQETWTLRQCIDYATAHNVQVQKNRVSEEDGEVSLWKAKGAVFPSLSFSTSQTFGYRPFEETTAIVQNGQVTNTSSKTTYQGSYGLNANVTLWNGGINQKNIEAQRLQNQINELTTENSELSVQEQIAQLYVEILYSKEAKEVNQKLAETAKSQYDRGVAMMEEGQLSKADVAQLEAQWRSAEYDVVNSETQTADFKRQLKNLLQLPMEEPFDVTGEAPTDEQVLAALPSSLSVYEQALATRPEIKSAELSIDAADLDINIARRGYYPTIGLSASLGDSHYSASDKSVGGQMKTNLNFSAGLTLSVPIFDNRQNKASLESAKLRKVTSQLDLEDKKNTLSSTIENYWLSANSNQQKFLSAKAKSQSQEVSYELLNEQFNNGLKNIVDLLQGRDNLLSAKQDELQSKYTALLNIQMLRFYSGEEIDM
ncbi:MAG: TolC family protein [Prevotellaceae bacterium]|nr:TolC family protein [Prevotellaceae bacterium]